MRSIGLVELAKIAGVAVSTVSRALDDNPRVSVATKQRIRALAAEHGFRINQTASALRKKRTGVIGVVIPLGHDVDQTLSDPFFMSLLGPVADALSGNDYDLLLSRVIPKDDDWLDAIVASGRVDGVILIGQSDQSDVIERTARRGVPMLVWGAHRDGYEQVTVGTDNVVGGEIAARHLIALGRRRLAFLGDPNVPEFADRYAGFHRAITQGAGLEEIALTLHLTDRDAYEGMVDFLARNAPPDGIFAASDVIAMGAMRAVSESGLRVPQDVSVIGYDDLSVAAHVTPPLTTIRQDTVRGGQLLVDLLMQRLAGKAVQSVTMKPELILRDSA